MKGTNTMSHTIALSIGIPTAAVFVYLSLLHISWALGGSSPSAAVIPFHAGKPLLTPTPPGTLLVALALLICALLVFGTLGIWRFSLPMWLFRVGMLGVAAVFLLRAIGDFRYLGFFKTVRDSSFARNDSWLYSPLCVAIAISCATLATCP
jgi:hypothetical protein